MCHGWQAIASSVFDAKNADASVWSTSASPSSLLVLAASFRLPLLWQAARLHSNQAKRAGRASEGQRRPVRARQGSLRPHSAQTTPTPLSLLQNPLFFRVSITSPPERTRPVHSSHETWMRTSPSISPRTSGQLPCCTRDLQALPLARGNEETQNAPAKLMQREGDERNRNRGTPFRHQLTSQLPTGLEAAVMSVEGPGARQNPRIPQNGDPCLSAPHPVWCGCGWYADRVEQSISGSRTLKSLNRPRNSQGIFRDGRLGGGEGGDNRRRHVQGGLTSSGESRWPSPAQHMPLSVGHPGRR